MSPGQWQPLAPGTTGGVSDVLRALDRALAQETGTAWTLTAERRRMAGRSDIYVVRGDRADGPPSRWVVKRPHPSWTQDDVDSPLTAAQELAVLQRLHRHFSALDLPYAVPAPVTYLPELDALVMEHVPGGTIKDLLTYGNFMRPAPLLEAVSSAGIFLRHLHALEVLPQSTVDLGDLARSVLAVAEEKLAPARLELPTEVRHTLEQVPSRTVAARRVWLHGDFGPANLVRAPGGRLVGLDASLATVGRPEHDLARFMVLVSAGIRLAPELVLGPVGRVRWELEDCLLSAYYGSPGRSMLFELTYLHQLCRRWCRLRELAQRHEKGARQRMKLALIDRHVPLLMRRSAALLRHGEAA